MIHQELYHNIECSVRSLSANVKLNQSHTLNEIRAAIRCVLRDNPDIFWFEHQYHYDEANSTIHFQYTGNNGRLDARWNYVINDNNHRDEKKCDIEQICRTVADFSHDIVSDNEIMTVDTIEHFAMTRCGFNDDKDSLLRAAPDDDGSIGNIPNIDWMDAHVIKTISDTINKSDYANFTYEPAVYSFATSEEIGQDTHRKNEIERDLDILEEHNKYDAFI